MSTAAADDKKKESRLRDGAALFKTAKDEIYRILKNMSPTINHVIATTGCTNAVALSIELSRAKVAVKEHILVGLDFMDPAVQEHAGHESVLRETTFRFWEKSIDAFVHEVILKEAKNPAEAVIVAYPYSSDASDEKTNWSFSVVFRVFQPFADAAAQKLFTNVSLKVASDQMNLLPPKKKGGGGDNKDDDDDDDPSVLISRRRELRSMLTDAVKMYRGARVEFARVKKELEDRESARVYLDKTSLSQYARESHEQFKIESQKKMTLQAWNCLRGLDMIRRIQMHQKRMNNVYTMLNKIVEHTSFPGAFVYPFANPAIAEETLLVPLASTLEWFSAQIQFSPKTFSDMCIKVIVAYRTFSAKYSDSEYVILVILSVAMENNTRNSLGEESYIADFRFCCIDRKATPRQDSAALDNKQLYEDCVAYYVDAKKAYTASLKERIANSKYAEEVKAAATAAAIPASVVEIKQQKNNNNNDDDKKVTTTKQVAAELPKATPSS